MDTRSTTKQEFKAKIEMGDILLAQPFWQEEDYKRSVILLLDHDHTGTTGIIVNKISNLIVHDALPQLNLYHPIYYGGVSHSKTVSYVHNFAELPNVKSLGNGLYFGGEPECLEEMIHTNLLNSGSVKFCAGFVEWAAGALENELNDSKWWKATISAEEFFTMPHDRLWAYKLLNSGHIYGIFNESDDPVMN